LIVSDSLFTEFYTFILAIPAWILHRTECRFLHSWRFVFYFQSVCVSRSLRDAIAKSSCQADQIPSS